MVFYFILNSLNHYFAFMSWVDLFKLRHNIVYRAISGVSGVFIFVLLNKCLTDTFLLNFAHNLSRKQQ